MVIVDNNYKKEYYQRNKERIIEYQKEYNKKNYEKRREYQKKYHQKEDIKRKKEEYSKQKEKCPYCMKELSQTYISYHIFKFHS